jgi:hypothetical protein
MQRFLAVILTGVGRADRSAQIPRLDTAFGISSGRRLLAANPQREPDGHVGSLVDADQWSDYWALKN